MMALTVHPQQAGLASTALRTVGRVLGHLTMIVAMVPCVVGGDSAAHAGAALLLFALAVGRAPRARRDAATLPSVLDALAMAVLSIAGVLCGHVATIGAASGHAHSGAQIVGPATIVAIVSVVVWVALRLSARGRVVAPRTERMPWPAVGAIVSTLMVPAMALMTFAHSL